MAHSAAPECRPPGGGYLIGYHRGAKGRKRMAFLSDQDAAFVRKRFEEELASEVTLEFFTPSIGGLTLPGQDAEIAEYTRQILTDVAALSPRITLNVHSMASEPDAAPRFGIARTPAFAIIGAADYWIRFYGMPAG